MKYPSLRGVFAVFCVIVASTAAILSHMSAQSYSGGGTYSGGSGSGSSGSGGYTSYLPSAPAASLQSSSMWNFQVPLARAGHSFALYWKDTSNVVHPGTYTNVPGIATATGVTGSQVPLYLAVTAYPPSGSNSAYTDWWLVDTTASQAGPHQMLGLVNAEWRAISGVTNTYYAVSSPRLDHALIAGSTGAGWTTLTKGQLLGTYTTDASGAATYQAATWFEAWGPGVPGRVVDLTVSRISRVNTANPADVA